MLRNNENAPLTGRERVHGTRLTSTKPDQNDEFFTDSVLDLDTTHSSRIPTPSQHKNIQAKERRARRINKAPSNAPQVKHRVSASESSVLQPTIRSLQSASSLRRSKSPNPLRTSALATPPHSRDGPPSTSPDWHIRSPPPRELPDVYQQIADEEDLAATEREFSDQDGYSEDELNEPALFPRPQNRPQVSLDPQLAPSHSSRASTPHQQQNRIARQDLDIDRTETASDPTGMSFAHQLSDRNLAAILTPHFTESARNRAKLREGWQNQKPVAFSKAGKIRLDSPLGRDVPEIPKTRIVAFSKADRQPLDGRIRSEGFDSSSDRPDSGASEPISENHRPHNDIWHNEDQPLKPLPINARVDRNFQFSRAHGFSNPRSALTEQNLEQQNKGGIAATNTNSAPSSLNSPRSEPRSQSRLPVARLNSVPDLADRFRHLRPSQLGVENRRPQEHTPTRDSSHLDWEAAAADVPLPTVEIQIGGNNNEHISALPQAVPSPDKSRRWENDFTGLSFQVSESPPVRSRSVQDPSLNLEIESLSKRAVTTSRLGEIYERNLQEQLRNGSRSSSIRSASQSSEHRPVIPGQEINNGTEANTAAVPNSPAVVIRSSSVGDASRDRGSVNLNGSQDTSQDVLQRLARASSNTPRSSPPAANTSRDVVSINLQTKDAGAEPILVPTHKESAASVSGLAPADRDVVVAAVQTPRVTGAWTDTLLPDTVKTVKQPDSSNYVQTPHVSAGGWVDTPAPVGKTRISSGMSPIVEEVLEELTNGIVKDKVEEIIDGIVEPASSQATTAASRPDMSKVGLEGMLDRAKQKISLQQDPTTAQDNDTLNLGNDTIQSLQDYLAQDVTVTGISIADDGTLRLDDGTQADPETLIRLSSELNRIANTVRGADQGISKIERAVSESEPHSMPEGSLMTDCELCASGSSQPHAHIHDIKHGGMQPTRTITLSFNMPFLFHPRNPDSKSRFLRPTPLGWTLISIFLWYTVECTMSEIYSRPEVAETYTWPSEPEPEFPYVLPTMIGRWTRLRNFVPILSYLLNPLWMFIVAIWRIVAITIGLTDGFVDSASETISTATKQVVETVTAAMGASSAMPDLGMMNDEFL